MTRKLDIKIHVDESDGAVDHFELDGNLKYASVTRYQYQHEKLLFLHLDRKEAQNLSDTLNEWLYVCNKIEEIK